MTFHLRCPAACSSIRSCIRASIEKDWQREEKERVLASERAHKQVLTVKKNMHLILKSSTGTLVTVAISTAPDGGFHRESVSSQAKPAHILHNMLGDQSADSMEASGGHPHSIPKCVNQLEDLRGGRQTKNDKSPVCCRFP